MHGEKQAALLPLKLLLFAYAGGPLPDWLRVEETVRVIELEAGQRLLGQGEQHPYLYLVRSGVLKSHETSPDSADRIASFHEEMHLIVPLTAAAFPGLQRIVSNELDTHPDDLLEAVAGRVGYSVTALTSAQVLRLDVAILRQLSLKYSRWADMMTTYLAVRLLHTLAEGDRLRTLTTEEHYRWLQSHRPGLVSRVKQRELASYLGVTDVGLSRIARRVRGATN